MLTLILLLIPLVTSLGAFLMNARSVKGYALISALASLAYTAWVVTLYTTGGLSQQFSLALPWIPRLGIGFSINLDGLSLLLVGLTNFLLPLIILSSFRSEVRNARVFYGLMLFMQFALLGVFTAADGFLFYVFWELALLPIWFICLLWGGIDRVRITMKFFLYTLSGSLLMLIGLIVLYLHTPGNHDFSLAALYAADVDPSMQQWLFWCFFAAFAIKIPLFPLHTWQPDTYTDAPVQGTMLLSGIMLKMGIYGLLRWLLPLLPDGVAEWGQTALWISAIGIVYASCMALVQQDFKRLLAYSSIAHVGMISAGIFSLTEQGIIGGIIQMIAHGVNVVGLFFVADILQRRMKTRELKELGGLANNSPMFTILFIIILLGSVALPLTNGFVGEFLMLSGIFSYSAVLAAVSGLSVILGAVYMLRSYQQIMLGEPHPRMAEFTGLGLSEKIVLITVAGVIILTGLFPGSLINLSQPAVDEIMAKVQDLY